MKKKIEDDIYYLNKNIIDLWLEDIDNLNNLFNVKNRDLSGIY